MARFRAVVTIHPAGLGGMPSRRHRSLATTKRVLDGIFGKRDVAEDADQRRHRLAVHLTEHTLNSGRFPMGGDETGHALRRPAYRRMAGLRSER